MNGPAGSLDDPPDPPPVDTAPDPATEPVRFNFPKAPLVVLAAVLGSLLAVLAGQILFSGSDITATGAAGEGQPGGHSPEPAVSRVDATGMGETGSDASEDETVANGAEGMVSSSIDRMKDPAYVTQRIAEGFHNDYRGVVDEAEARCMAREVVAMFGVDRLLQITEAMADANTHPESFDRNDPRFLNDDEAAALNVRMRPCVGDEAARRLNLG